MAEPVLSTRIVKLLEGVRIAEGMSIPHFISHFDVSRVAYFNWRKAAEKNVTIHLKLATIEKGLRELGYEPYVIIMNAKKK